jgi:hypothetical protein
MSRRNKMDFGKKVDILADLGVWYKDDENLSTFIWTHDLGIPAAILLRAGGVEALSEKGIGWVEIAWEALCDRLKVDPDGVYDDIDSMLEFSDEF